MVRFLRLGSKKDRELEEGISSCIQSFSSYLFFVVVDKVIVMFIVSHGEIGFCSKTKVKMGIWVVIVCCCDGQLWCCEDFAVQYDPMKQSHSWHNANGSICLVGGGMRCPTGVSVGSELSVEILPLGVIGVRRQPR